MQRIHVLTAAVFVTIVAGISCASLYAPNRGELFDKRGWSVLQAMSDPPHPPSTAILFRRDEFAVLGFPGIGQPSQQSGYGPGTRWSWVLLNEHHADRVVKQMPEFRAYDLRCVDLQRAVKAVPDADAYAVEYLRSICV